MVAVDGDRVIAIYIYCEHSAGNFLLCSTEHDYFGNRAIRLSKKGDRTCRRFIQAQ